MKKVILILTLFTTTAQPKIFAQSNGCGGSPTNLPTNSSCVTQTFANNQNGTTQTVNASCASGYGTAYEDVWYSLTGTGNTVTVTMSGANQDGVLAAFTGCGTGQLACATVNVGTTGSISFPSTSGTTYYIQIQRRSGTNSSDMSGNICAVSSSSGPANDNPCGATALSVGASCSFTAYTNVGATNTTGVTAPGCASYSGSDVWFTAVVPASGNLIIDSNTGSITDGGMAVYTGTCGSLTLLECDDDDSGNGSMPYIAVNSQPAGTTVYIRFWQYGGGTGTFSLCAYAGGSGGGSVSNDDPCTATPLTVNSSCSYSAFTNAGATASTGVPAPGCASYSGGDVWFTAVVPASGTLILDANTGVITDGGMAVYTGTCGSLTLLECDDDDSGNGLMPMIQVSGQLPGTTIYVRFWEYGNDNNGSFSLCAYAGAPTGPCGNPLNNDYCEAPATLFQGGGTWSSSTTSTYSSDTPANTNSVFCGSIENNSWYQFMAMSTTETFNFTSVSNCLNSSGIQAQVFQITHDANGCCTGLTSVSNCWNPGTQTTGVVTATGLTVGNNYVLMVDGYAGDQCNFTVSNWTAVGILPVKLIGLHALSMQDHNIIAWQTVTELNNDFFQILRSYDGKSFSVIGTVKGAGTSNELLNYQFEDYDIRTGVVYYRLEQFDYNGAHEFSEIVALNRTVNQYGLIAAYPNPASTHITIEINSEEQESGRIELMDARGEVVIGEDIVQYGFGKFTYDIAELAQGVYFIAYRNGTETSIKKFIKQ